MARGRLVVIGGSVGGGAASKKLGTQLRKGFPAPIVLVVHIGNHESILPRIVAGAGPLPAQHVRDKERLRDSQIYVAPPDHHVLVDGHTLRLSRGPKEHHARPAIDPLFLSAALTHGPGVIGVVLTGWGEDGTPGLDAIKRCGGLAVVQNPETAEAPSMPLS